MQTNRWTDGKTGLLLLPRPVMREVIRSKKQRFLYNPSQAPTVACETLEPLFFSDYSPNIFSNNEGFGVLRQKFSELFKKNRGSNFLQASVNAYSVIIWKYCIPGNFSVRFIIANLA